MSVAEPLRIRPATRSRGTWSRSRSIKKKGCLFTVLSHPLELSPSFSLETGCASGFGSGSDSDDSGLESSYNESIVSTTLTEYSLMSSSLSVNSLFNLSALRPTTHPSVSTTLITANATTSSIVSDPEQRKLLKLFKPRENAQVDPFPKLKRCLSDLSASSAPVTTSKRLFRRFYGDKNPQTEPSTLSAQKSFLLLFMNYSMLGLSVISNSSFEAFTLEVTHNVFDEIPTECNAEKEEELKTFSVISDAVDVSYDGRRARNREFRINNDFLKRYALDYSARASFLLPTNPDDVSVMVHKENLNQFNSKYGLEWILELSREKLWNLVVLPPRSDSFPSTSINSEHFVFDGYSENRYGSIAVKKGNYIPWVTHKNGLKPAGTIRGTKSLGSSCSPTLGKTAAQYTIKGWCNERWSHIGRE